MPNRENLLAEIAREESRLVNLRVEVEATTARLAGLREQLALPARQVPIQSRLIAHVATYRRPTPPRSVCSVPCFAAARTSEKRLCGYRAIGSARDETPRRLSEIEDDAVVESDEEVSRDLEEKKP